MEAPRVDKPATVDRPALRRSLARTAAQHEHAAVLAREVESRLLERLDLTRLEPRAALIAPARTGAAAARLARRFPRARLSLLEPVPELLGRAPRRSGWLRRAHRVAGHPEAPPFPSRHFELVWSNLGLPAVADPDAAASALRRLLSPAGLLMFSSLGPASFGELRTALATVLGEGAPAPPALLDMHDVGDALVRAGLEGVVMENETFTLTYPDIRSLLAEARATGTGGVLSDRPRGLWTPARLADLEAAMPREAGRLVISVEVVYGHAWRPDTGMASADGGGQASIAVDDIGRR
jgi:malonyl-CoA O-methyltransferase